VLTLATKTRALSTGPKGEKICNKLLEGVVLGMLPIHRARVGTLSSSPATGFTGDELSLTGAAGVETGIATAGVGTAAVEGGLGGVGTAAVETWLGDTLAPVGTGSILP
jgi:hypothetical protein